MDLKDKRKEILEEILKEGKAFGMAALSERADKIEQEKFTKAADKHQEVFFRNVSDASNKPIGTINELNLVIPNSAITSGPTVSAAVGTTAGMLKTTYGIPPEISLPKAEEVMREKGQKLVPDEFNAGLKLIDEAHKQLSKKEGAKLFAGGLGGKSPKIVAGHTATHLLHAALRQILGDHVHQTGSNITEERVRFDFFHSKKLTDEQIKKVEDLVNQKIKENLAVKKEMMTPEDAKKSGAIGLFGEKYADRVLVYSISDPLAGSGQVFSKEICGGPHVSSTKEMGHFTIVKEEGLGQGRRRIYSKLD